ncbi:MAG: hypothetical protein IH991_24945, partial [Planctomycetes bacterium]|nr:hypothetical protein [Planctomycetota bacterium]
MRFAYTILVIGVMAILTELAPAESANSSSGHAFTQILAVDAIDYRATCTFADKKVAFTNYRTMGAVLDKGGAWKAGDVGRKHVADTAFGYRLALKKPTQIGSMIVRFSRPDARVKFHALKPGAPYPGDVKNPDHWVDAWSHFEHGVHHVVLPPEVEQTRAIYCQQLRNVGAAQITRLRCFQGRLFNITKLGVAQAEWLLFGNSPTNIIHGTPWHNVGAHWESGEIARAPVTDVEPSWVVLNWFSPQRPCGLRLRGNIRKFKVYTFVGDEKTNPALADDKDWIRLNIQSEEFRQGIGQTPTHLIGFRPRATRALKVLLQETVPSNKQILTINELAVFTDLGERPTPSYPEKNPNLPPVALPYELESAGDVAVVIETLGGDRVRNLVAQVSREAGINREPWDLKDEHGHIVSPGVYRWKGIYAPPLELIYRHSPYPNVEMYAPGRLPWNYRTQDGWLANHTNHTAICAAGDKLYVATGGTEGGHASLEANLKGQKLCGFGWGAHQNGIFTDGKSVFIHTGAGVYRLDPETGRTSSVFSISNSGPRRGRVRGFATDGRKIYVAHYDSVPFFQLATNTNNVDEENNFPKLRESVPTKEFYNIPSTPRADMVRLFRLGDYIPGLIAPEGITHIPSTRGRGANQFVVL